MLQNQTNTKLPNKRIGSYQEFCIYGMYDWKDRKNLIHKISKMFCWFSTINKKANYKMPSNGENELGEKNP